MDGLYWAILPIDNGSPLTSTSILQTIEAWFYNSSPAEIARGDVGHQSFQDHVNCVGVANDALHPDMVYVDVRQLYPMKDALTIFFALRVKEYEIYLLGAATYQMAMHYGGAIPRLDLVRSRSFFPPFQMPSPVSVEAGAEMYIWPAHFGEVVETARFYNLPIERRVFMDYVEWIVVCEKMHPHLPWDAWPRYEFEDPYYERAAVRFGQMVGAEIELGGFHIPNTSQDMRRIRERWDVARLKVEEKQYWARMEAFKTETDIIRLMKYNYLHLWLEREGNVVDENPRDQQCFYQRFSNRTDVECPTLFFRVPMEEVPLSLSRQLPLYPGGVHHLSYLDVSQWVWNKYLIQNQQFTFERKLPYVGTKLKRFLQRIRRVIVMYMATYVPQPQFGGEALRGRGGNGGERQQLDLEGGADIQDIEDLWSMMPPCVAALRENRRFPKNIERLRATQILVAAGVSINTIMEVWLRPLNEKFPHSPSAIPLEARFDAARAMQKGVAIHFCGNVITDTIDRRADTLQCPFVHQLPANIAYDTPEAKRAVVNGCKQMCGGGGKRFLGPHDLMRQNMVERGYVEPAPILKDDDKDGRSGGESDLKKRKVDKYEPLPLPEKQTHCPGDVYDSSASSSEDEEAEYLGYEGL